MLDKKITVVDLFQYFECTLSADKRLEVEEWISKSYENKKVFEDYYKLFLAISCIRFKNKSVAEKALKKVNRKIRRQKNDNV